MRNILSNSSYSPPENEPVISFSPEERQNTLLSELRSNVKIQPKVQKSTEQLSVLNEHEGDGDVLPGDNGALKRLGSLGKKISSEDDASVFNFSRKDLDDYQENCFLDCLPGLDDDNNSCLEGPISASPGNNSSCSSKHTDVENETNRSRRGSKKEKKNRKPPKSLNMNGRRGNTTPGVVDTPIMSPHTPKWRSEAVSSSGCLIHSKAINVSFLLQNYLCLLYNDDDKHYTSDFRGLYPTKCEIIKNSSTAVCQRSDQVEKKQLSRYVSHGFITDKSNVSQDKEQKVGNNLCRRCKSHLDSSLEDIYYEEQHVKDPGGSQRPDEIPELKREQSKDSGVFSYNSPYVGNPYSHYFPPSPYYMPPYMPAGFRGEYPGSHMWNLPTPPPPSAPPAHFYPYPSYYPPYMYHHPNDYHPNNHHHSCGCISNPPKSFSPRPYSAASGFRSASPRCFTRTPSVGTPCYSGTPSNNNTNDCGEIFNSSESSKGGQVGGAVKRPPGNWATIWNRAYYDA